MQRPYDLIMVARLMYRRLRMVAHAVGQCIGEMDGSPADHCEFYWLQTAPIHRISPADPIARGLWGEAFDAGYRQGAARRQSGLQEGEAQRAREQPLGVNDV